MDNRQAAVFHAMLDLSALVKAKDWMEVCELQQAAQETLDELMDTFESVAEKFEYEQQKHTHLTN